MQYRRELPPVVEPHSEATREKTVETVLRTLLVADLKYSVTLVAEPEAATDWAWRARLAQLLMAVRTVVARVPVQSLWTAVRFWCQAIREAWASSPLISASILLDS